MRFPWSPQLYRIGCVVEPHFSRPLYEHAAWMALFPFVDAVFSAIKTPAFIRSYQTRPGRDANLGFGRMPWSRASNELWTTKYLTAPEPVQFWATEVWAPSWNHRVEHGGDPDAFCRIERLAYPDRQAFVLAVRRELAGSVAEAADTLLDAIAAAMQEPRRAVFDRTWAERQYFFRAIRVDQLHLVGVGRVLEWADKNPRRLLPGFREF
jgi:hypothetical protein